MKRSAFTMLELVFVIVIMGIIGKFGTEFLAQVYNSFIYSKINSELQRDSAYTVDFIAKRLESRINPSTIKRKSPYNTVFVGATVIVPVSDEDDYKFIEWVSYDLDGFRADGNTPYWSGIVDIDNAVTTKDYLYSPQTNTTAINTLIQVLSDSNSSITDAAIYFPANSYNINSFGWQGGDTLTDHNQSMHPINSNANAEQFISRSSHGSDFSGMQVRNRYMLAWTAYAVVHDDSTGDLTLYYNYQPWLGENYTNGSSSLIAQNVTTFKVKAVADLFSIQVCIGSDLTNEEHSICKEKTIF